MLSVAVVMVNRSKSEQEIYDYKYYNMTYTNRDNIDTEQRIVMAICLCIIRSKINIRENSIEFQFHNDKKKNPRFDLLYIHIVNSGERVCNVNH